MARKPRSDGFGSDCRDRLPYSRVVGAGPCDRRYELLVVVYACLSEGDESVSARFSFLGSSRSRFGAVFFSSCDFYLLSVSVRNRMNAICCECQGRFLAGRFLHLPVDGAAFRPSIPSLSSLPIAQQVWCRKAAEREIGWSSGTVDDDVESGCAGKAMVCFRVPSMFAPGISIVC